MFPIGRYLPSVPAPLGHSCQKKTVFCSPSKALKSVLLSQKYLINMDVLGNVQYVKVGQQLV